MDPRVMLSADHHRTASTLLEHLSKPEQSKLLKSLVASLQPNDAASVTFVASLVETLADPDTRKDFVTFLDHVIRVGEAQCVASVYSRSPELGKELISRAVDVVSKAKSTAEESQSNYDALRSYLKFLKLTVSHLWMSDVHQELLEGCLDLLATPTLEISLSARDIIFALFSSRDGYVVSTAVWPSERQIWNTVRTLVASERNEIHITLGYSLWLRWILSERIEKGISTTVEYWRLLQEGLRRGDTERRKSCLNILRLSTAYPNIVEVSKDESQQYARYCTVFETIVLGRYINQIQECERDLDFFATESSVSSKWFYTLLASALDGRMQDTNRKFIGNWVMRSSLTPTTEFIAFFQEDFLPWATQGQLFVSTLKRKRGILRCLHGDRLAHFLQRLRRNTSHDSQLVDITVDVIHRRRNSIFAYAMVYLLAGLINSLEEEHMEKIADIRGFPEVARDYVSSRTSRLLLPQKPASTPSQRELQEKTAIEKCRTFNGDRGALDDIWGDLEYLEFPKRLLMVIPESIFKPEVVQRATDRALGTSLAEKLRTLQDIAQTKTFLFAPLVCAIRKVLASIQSVVDVLEIAGFVLWFAEHPPEPTVDLMLEEAICPLTPFSYEHYFGQRPSYGFAAFLDLVSRLYKHQALLEAIIIRILSRWNAQKIPPPTVVAWKTTLQLQVLFLCFEQYNITTTSQMHALLEDLFHLLAIEPLPHYRYLLEAIVVRFIMQQDLQETLLSRLATKDHHSNPKHLASLMKISVILACGRESTEEFALQLATTFVPLAASSKVVIRHEAQWQMPVLMDHARAQGWTSITGNPAFSALDDYIRSLERFHEPPPERQIGRFDPQTDNTMSNLVEGKWLDLNQTEAPIASHDDFVKICVEDLPPNAPATCIPLGDKIDRPIVPQFEELSEEFTTKSSNGPRSPAEVPALQTKGVAYLARTLSDTRSLDSRPNNIIVVASLVDNPYNLGGLSRVSEIFGTSFLTLQNQNVLSNKDFTSVSVSSHLHLPIVQLSASGVPDFLAERKGEGFSVVGIEQTDRSVILGTEAAKLPEKVVLVVGSEKEGIPAVVLAECDMLVEIPQQGITRSLNVQNAAGIVLYEHVRQNRRSD